MWLSAPPKSLCRVPEKMHCSRSSFGAASARSRNTSSSSSSWLMCARSRSAASACCCVRGGADQAELGRAGRGAALLAHRRLHPLLYLEHLGLAPPRALLVLGPLLQLLRLLPAVLVLAGGQRPLHGLLLLRRAPLKLLGAQRRLARHLPAQVAAVQLRAVVLLQGTVSEIMSSDKAPLSESAVGMALASVAASTAF